MNQQKIRSGRPVRGDKKRERVSATLAPEDIDWISLQSKIKGLSRSEILESLIRQARSNLQSATPDIPVVFSQSKISKFCRDRRVKRLSLFGSVLTNRFTEKSDIDVLIEFQPNVQPSFFEMAKYQNELSHCFNGRVIDLKTSSELSSYFRDDVMKGAKLLYEERD